MNKNSGFNLNKFKGHTMTNDNENRAFDTLVVGAFHPLLQNANSKASCEGGKTESFEDVECIYQNIGDDVMAFLRKHK
jgi:hypothetical protein